MVPKSLRATDNQSSRDLTPIVTEQLACHPPDQQKNCCEDADRPCSGGEPSAPQADPKSQGYQERNGKPNQWPNECLIELQDTGHLRARPQHASPQRQPARRIAPVPALGGSRPWGRRLWRAPGITDRLEHDTVEAAVEASAWNKKITAGNIWLPSQLRKRLPFPPHRRSRST
jgi:hypothetical protein